MKPLFYLIVAGLLTTAALLPSPTRVIHPPLYSPNRIEVYSVVSGRTNLLGLFQAGHDPVKNHERFQRANKFANGVPPAIRRVKFIGEWTMALDYTNGTWTVSDQFINRHPEGYDSFQPRTNKQIKLAKPTE